MAEPLALVGLAAAILQFTEFAVKVASRLSEFTTANDEVPDTFRQIHAELPLILATLSKIREQANSGGLDHATENALLHVTHECRGKIQQLDNILDQTIPKSGASSWEKRRKALVSIARDAKVQKLVESLARYLDKLSSYQVADTAARIATLTRGQGPDSKLNGRAIWLVPFDRNTTFTGREATFNTIEATLSVKQDTQPQAALCGLGGIGKSQIALEYCYRVRQRTPFRSVFWVNAATPLRFEESFKRIATACNLTRSNEADADTAHLVKDWLEGPISGDWLMVVDNVDDAPSFFERTLNSGRPASAYVPHTSKGTLLYTTRTSAIAVDLTPLVEPIVVEELTEADGLRLVCTRLHGRSKQATDKEILDLLVELEFIPLAITQAIAFITKRRWTIEQYLSTYRSGVSARTKLLDYEFVDHGRQAGTRESIAMTWSISFESIRASDPRAAELLCVVCFLQNQRIAESILLSAFHHRDSDPVVPHPVKRTGDLDFEDAIGLLLAYSLIDTSEWNSLPRLFNTHRLVQHATRWWLAQQGPHEMDRFAGVALRAVASAFPDPRNVESPEYFPECEILYPHAEPLLLHCFGVSTDILDLARARLLASTGRYIIRLSLFDQAAQRFQQSVEIRTKRLGDRHPDTLRSRGLVFWLRANFEREPGMALVGRELVEHWREVMGDDHPETIDAMSDFATAMRWDPNYSKAESEAAQREALSKSRLILGPRHPDTINCMTNLASVLYDQDKFEEAIEYQREAYAAHLAVFDAEHPHVLMVEGNLAVYLLSYSQTAKEGLAMMKKNIEVRKKVLGVDHRDTLTMVWIYGNSLRKCGRVSEALALFESTIAETRNGPRQDNVHTVQVLDRLRYAIGSWGYPGESSGEESEIIKFRNKLS